MALMALDMWGGAKQLSVAASLDVRGRTVAVVVGVVELITCARGSLIHADGDERIGTTPPRAGHW